MKLWQENYSTERGSSLMEVRVQPTCRACFFCWSSTKCSWNAVPSSHRTKPISLLCRRTDLESNITDMTEVINFKEQWGIYFFLGVRNIKKTKYSINIQSISEQQCYRREQSISYALSDVCWSSLDMTLTWLQSMCVKVFIFSLMFPLRSFPQLFTDNK